MKKKQVLKSGITFIFFGITLLSMSAFVQANSTILYPTDDSYVDSGEPDENNGNSRFLNSGKWAGENREMQTYISFDISTVSSGWSSAKLSLCSYVIAESKFLDIVRTPSNWNEASITWNNKPAHYSTLLTITVSSLSPTTKLYDLSSQLEYEFSTNKEVFSICIYMPVNQGAIVGMISKDFVETEKSDWPRLIFSYPSNPQHISFIPLWALLLIVFLSIVSVIFYFKKRRRISFLH